LEHHKFRFLKGREYAFFHEDVHLLMIDFERDDKKEIFRIDGQEEDGTYILEFPGELYIEQIKEIIASIFFVQVQEENREGRYALGAYFTFMRKEYALYYDRENLDNLELVFFRANATGTGEYELTNITDEEEYREVIGHIQDRYGHVLFAE
jgi:hypothetical protein